MDGERTRTDIHWGIRICECGLSEYFSFLSLCAQALIQHDPFVCFSLFGVQYSLFSILVFIHLAFHFFNTPYFALRTGYYPDRLRSVYEETAKMRMVATVWRHVELRTDSLTGRIYKPLHPFRWGVIFSTPSLAHSLRFLNLTDYNGIYSFGSDSSSALCSCFPPQCSASQSRSGKCFGPSLISLLHAIDLTHSILLVTFTTHLNHDNMFRDFW